jgi:hypothetical protein
MNNDVNNIVEVYLFSTYRILRYFRISNILLRTAQTVTVDTPFVILALIMQKYESHDGNGGISLLIVIGNLYFETF